MQFISKKLSMPVQVEDWVKNEKPNGWTLGKDYKDGYEILREQLRPSRRIYVVIVVKHWKLK